MMTSRERVLAALARHEPDVVPADYFGAPEIESQLSSHFGVDAHDALLDCLGTDLRQVEPDYVGPELNTFEDGSFEDRTGSTVRPWLPSAGNIAAMPSIWGDRDTWT